TVITDRPNKLIDRTSVFLGMVLSSFEIGRVINFSTSSALRPGHWVMTRPRVLVTSGKASIGVWIYEYIPAPNKKIAPIIMNKECLSENATILSTNFFINYFLFACSKINNSWLATIF